MALIVYSPEEALELRKGKALPPGTIRDWKGKKVIKTAKGDWVPYRGPKKLEAPSASEVPGKAMVVGESYRFIQENNRNPNSESVYVPSMKHGVISVPRKECMFFELEGVGYVAHPQVDVVEGEPYYNTDLVVISNVDTGLRLVAGYKPAVSPISQESGRQQLRDALHMIGKDTNDVRSLVRRAEERLPIKTKEVVESKPQKGLFSVLNGDDAGAYVSRMMSDNPYIRWYADVVLEDTDPETVAKALSSILYENPSDFFTGGIKNDSDTIVQLGAESNYKYILDVFDELLAQKVLEHKIDPMGEWADVWDEMGFIGIEANSEYSAYEVMGEILGVEAPGIRDIVNADPAYIAAKYEEVFLAEALDARFGIPIKDSFEGDYAKYYTPESVKLFVEKFENAEISEISPFNSRNGNISETFLGVFEHEGDRMFAIVKPESGMHPGGRKVTQERMVSNEVAAYLLDDFLGLGLVPPTFEKTIGNETASAQAFIGDAITAAVSPTSIRGVSEERLAMASIFDMLVQNDDRHNNNYMFFENEEGETDIRLIDNGLTFSEETVFSEVLSFYYREFSDRRMSSYPIVEQILEKIVNGEDELKELLSDRVGEQTVELMVEKALWMLTNIDEPVEKFFFRAPVMRYPMY